MSNVSPYVARASRRAQIDHPNLRASCICVLCKSDKHVGLLVCWPCFNRHGLSGLDGINHKVEAELDVHEALASARVRLEEIRASGEWEVGEVLTLTQVIAP